MRKTALSICLAGVILGPSSAFAQASVGVRIDLPVVLPRLVVVSPGIEVVPDVDYEVFRTDGWYWVRYDDGWYRSRTYRGGWVPVPMRGVPPGLSRIPPGQYKKWHPVRGPAHGGGPGWKHGDHGGGGWKGPGHAEGGFKGGGKPAKHGRGRW